jgi:pimeloyl-ACP methyl ester carboxylesterase
MARPGKHQETAPQPRLRRAYYDCRYGQLHLHNAIPPGGGFDELTSVICLHGDGEDGAVFRPAMQELGVRRSVYAPDLPGTGGTDPAPGVPPAQAAADVVADFLDSMRLRTVDLVARGSACAAALGLAGQRSAAVRRVVLIDPAGPVHAGGRVSVLTATEATPQRLVALLAP